MNDSLSCDDLDQLIVRAISNSISGKRTCFALSGGVDSTLLTSVASRHKLVEPAVAYTAVTNAGNDLEYALHAASILGIEVRQVIVPTGSDALDFYDDMSSRAKVPLSLVGNSIGFAAVCAAAKADGFDAIVDGTGAEQMTAGNSRIILNWLALAKDAGRQDLIQKFAARNGWSLIKKAEINPSEFANISQAIEYDLRQSKFIFWKRHHILTERATEIEIISPFLSKELSVLACQNLDWYCDDGWLKSPLRKILATHTDEVIAYRGDKQGLRWKKQNTLSGCRERMRQTIKQYDGTRSAPVWERLAFVAGISSIGSMARMYEAATANRIAAV